MAVMDLSFHAVMALVGNEEEKEKEDYKDDDDPPPPPTIKHRTFRHSNPSFPRKVRALTGSVSDIRQPLYNMGRRGEV